MEIPAVQYNPSALILKPLEVPIRLLLGPGPSNPHPRVQRAFGMQLVGHLHPEFYAIMDEIQAGLKYAFQTENSLTLAVDGSGHAAMEAAIVNVVEPGEKVLILENGIWGERAREIAERCGADVTSLVLPIGEVFTLGAIEEGLKVHKPRLLFVCQGETSGGVAQPLEGIGELCTRHDCLLLVDTVASLGGVPFLMDKWKVDIVYCGSQKVLGAPPGASPISFGPRARAKMALRKTKVQSFYFDMNWLLKYWAVDGATRVYHHTASVSTFYGLRESLSLLAEEGLEASWRKHRRNAELLWEGLEKLGLELFVKDQSVRLHTVTAIKIPDDIKDWKELISYAMKTHSVEIAGGLGPSYGKIWRIGLLGNNSTPENVHKALAAMKGGLEHCRSLQQK